MNKQLTRILRINNNGTHSSSQDKEVNIGQLKQELNDDVQIDRVLVSGSPENPSLSGEGIIYSVVSFEKREQIRGIS